MNGSECLLNPVSTMLSHKLAQDISLRVNDAREAASYFLVAKCSSWFAESKSFLNRGVLEIHNLFVTDRY